MPITWYIEDNSATHGCDYDNVLLCKCGCWKIYLAIISKRKMSKHAACLTAKGPKKQNYGFLNECTYFPWLFLWRVGSKKVCPHTFFVSRCVYLHFFPWSQNSFVKIICTPIYKPFCSSIHRKRVTWWAYVWQSKPWTLEVHWWKWLGSKPKTFILKTDSLPTALWRWRFCPVMVQS